jgi:D-erythrose 4-phosphate dehydrogenase
MMRLAINGYGRIGRSVLRALYESGAREQMQIVAINEPAGTKTMAHLTRYDSTHGRFNGTVEDSEGLLSINGDDIHITHDSALNQLPWGELSVDVVLECSGTFTDRGTAEQHLTIISSAACSTNCVVPVIKVLNDSFGIDGGVITTIHSAMNDQPVIDAYHHTDLRKTRAAMQSIIPVDTSLALGIDRLLPELSGRFQAQAMRVPTVNVSAIDLSVMLNSNVDTAAVNAALAVASTGYLNGILGYTDEPLASCDFNHDPRSGIVDASQTRVSREKLVKVLVWFDNEWGYANRMLDTLLYWCGLPRPNPTSKG